MSDKLAKVHLLSVDDISANRLQKIFAIADFFSVSRMSSALQGKIVASIFLESSTRTRLSFNAACLRLGGQIIEVTSSAMSSLAKGESMADTARVISGYADAIVLRSDKRGEVAAFAEHSLVPVINGGDGDNEHPTQALLDLYTMANRFGGLARLNERKLKLSLVGDLRYGRTVHSLIALLGKFAQVEFSFVAPPQLQINEQTIKSLVGADVSYNLVDNIEDGIRNADIIYSTRFQTERLPDDGTNQRLFLEQQMSKFAIDDQVIEKCCPQVFLMHPLPRNAAAGMPLLEVRKPENQKNLGIFEQSDNGVPIRMGVFCEVFGIDP